MTALPQIADKCIFDVFSLDDIVRDRIIFGIAENKVRERLLHEPKLSLTKTLDICRISGSLMYIPDTLSCVYLKEMLPLKEVKSLELVDYIEYLRVSLANQARIGPGSCLCDSSTSHTARLA